jgi:hypothetical protein
MATPDSTPASRSFTVAFRRAASSDWLRITLPAASPSDAIAAARALFPRAQDHQLFSEAKHLPRTARHRPPRRQGNTRGLTT